MKTFALIAALLCSACSCGGIHMKTDGTVLVDNPNDSCDLFYESGIQVEICGKLASRQEWHDGIIKISHAYNEALLGLGLPPLAPFLPGSSIRVVDYVKDGKYAGMYVPGQERVYLWIEDKTRKPINSALLHEWHHMYEQRSIWITDEDIDAAIRTPQHFATWVIHAYVDQYVRWVVDQDRQGGPPKKPF